MKRRDIYGFFLFVLILAIGAATFVFPSYVNKGIDSVNEKKNSISQIDQFSNIPQVPEIPFRLGLDLQGGTRLAYQADLSAIRSDERDSAMQGLRDVIERRVNIFGVSEPVVQIQGSGENQRLIVELAGISDPQQAVELIGATPFLEFREPRENYEEIIENQEGDPFQSTELTGRYLERADVMFHSLTNEPLITLSFTDEGAQLFEEITARNIGKPVAIYLDGAPIQVATVEDTISGGQAQITGIENIQVAQEVVRNLNIGALPVPIELLSQRNVGPSLGALSLQQSIQAALWGLGGVLLFMILFYRLPGLFAAFALLLYGLFFLLLLKVFSVTLTLAGIAGVILSIGMAVDANILIFSRMREELKEGRNFAGSVQEGFRRAWPAIRDGNITTLLVTGILFFLGSSFVQGFALTLFIGILLSMVSAMFIMRAMLRSFEGTRLANKKRLWL